MRLRKSPKRFLLWLLMIGLGVLIVLIDWRFVYRAVTYPEAPIMAVGWYEPKAQIQGAPQTALPVGEQPPSPKFEAALETVADYASERNSTGLIVMYQGDIVFERYWRGHTADSQFNAMSMTKSVLGLLIGQAIAEGAIASLDDPAANYLPEWRQDKRANITLRDLIYMQSGLRNERSTTSPTSDLVHLYIGSHIEKTALSIPSVRPPGEAFEYNNVNSQVLAIVLQRATGMSYTDYLTSRLWQPLEADNASVWLDRPDGMGKAFCCLFATARDWARIGQMLLDQGRWQDTQVVPTDWVTAMLTPSPLESSFGKHIWISARTADHPNVETTATDAYADPQAFHLDGRGMQRVFVMPTYGLVIVRMGEQPGNWDDAVIPNTLIEALQ